ncbi:MAG: MarR family transcriptional regulator [Alphaproteobacteria bacterium]|nr:MarR family transcriptional regulator [Alphaproteobacteria bacterium]
MTQTFDAFEPGDCVSYRLRRAARKAAAHFDKALRPVGLRNTQFTLLGALDHLGDISIGALSDELATDATTLNRNLAVLVRRDLVEDIPADDGRVRQVRLTGAGRKLFAKSLPFWRAAQDEILATLEAGQWADMRSNLRTIESACDRQP